MNYVFISPAYPVTCTLFCERLHEMGVNVLGIGDVPYDDLNEGLKGALMEYYYVDSLEDYDRVYRAVAFYIHKYGRIDWLESLNEYWLPADARLRTDFNIAVGTREHDIWTLVKKSGMKKVFLDAGIPTARQHIVTDLKAGKAFVEEVGYPVIVKPDIGVGANGAMKVESEEDLISFYEELPEETYVMEEFLSGDICTYDAVIDSHCEPLFESMCTRDMRIYSQANDGEVYHFRDKNGLEADMIIALNDGRWAAVEVKLGNKQIEEAACHLQELARKVNDEKMGSPSFLMVLTGGEYAYQRKDGVLVVPIGCLKD